MGGVYTRIPLGTVTHITHDRAAALIRSTVATEHYTFKPAQKLGKQFGDDRLPLGETYRHVENRIFSKIPRSERDPVFCGRYSWWGVNVSEWYKEGGAGESLLERIRNVQLQGFQVADVLSENPKSRYGNNAFSIKLSDLLSSYERSRIDMRGSHVCLRVGGTLRYKNEICYIVVVCLQHDHALNDLASIADAQDTIDHNGLVDSKGKVVDYWQTPDFKAKYVVTSKRDGAGGYQNFSWEQMVFALYYPNNGEDLKLCCEVEKMKESRVQHSSSFCLSTRTGPNGTRLCPNDPRY